jgi:hypothetical protein
MTKDTQLDKDIQISEEIDESGVRVRSFALNSSDPLSRAVVAVDIVVYQEIGYNNAIFGYVPIFRTKELAIQAAIGGQLTNILPYWINGGSVTLTQPITNFKYLIITAGFAGDGSSEAHSIVVPPFLYGRECVIQQPPMLEAEVIKFVVSGNVLRMTYNRTSTGKTSNNKITMVYGVS